MALTNDEKAFLVKRVKREIARGSTIKQTCQRLMIYGYKESTIRQYFKTFS